MHVNGLREPKAPEPENVTVPVGAVAVEGGLMSVTVAEQLETSLTMTAVGVQLTVVVVVWIGAGEVAIIAVAGPLLEWRLSP